MKWSNLHAPTLWKDEPKGQLGLRSNDLPPDYDPYEEDDEEYKDEE